MFRYNPNTGLVHEYLKICLHSINWFYITPSGSGIDSLWDWTVWIVSWLSLISDGLYLDWYSLGRSFKSMVFTTGIHKLDIYELA